MNSMSNPASKKNALEQYALALHDYRDRFVMPIIKHAIGIHYKEKPEVRTYLSPSSTPTMLYNELLPEYFDGDCFETNLAERVFRTFKDDLNFGGDVRFHFHTDYTAFQMLGFKYTNDCEVADVTLFLMGDVGCNSCTFDPEYDRAEYEDSVYEGSSWAVPMFHVRFKDGRHVLGPCCIIECYGKDDPKRKGHTDKRSVCYEMFEWFTSKP